MSTTFDFEKPIAELELQIEKVKQISEKTKVDMSATIIELETKLEATRHQVYSNLSGWENVQISRHPERPYTLSYIEMICDDFIELHGDRTVKDDKAIVGGFASRRSIRRSCGGSLGPKGCCFVPARHLP